MRGKKRLVLLLLTIWLLFFKCTYKKDIDIFDPINHDINIIKTDFKILQGVDVPIYFKNLTICKEAYELDFKEKEILNKKWVFENIKISDRKISDFIDKNNFEELCKLNSTEVLIYSSKYKHVYKLSIDYEYSNFYIYSKW